MPRYFFDMQDSDGLHRDGVGDDLDGFEEAREQAQALLSHMVGERLPDGDYRAVVCDVRDEAGLVVYRGEIVFRGVAEPGGIAFPPR